MESILAKFRKVVETMIRKDSLSPNSKKVFVLDNLFDYLYIIRYLKFSVF